MSNIHRTPEEYTMLYAHDHCDGDQEEAAGHVFVSKDGKRVLNAHRIGRLSEDNMKALVDSYLTITNAEYKE